MASYAGLALKIYCGVYLLLFLFGWTGIYVPVWGWIQTFTTYVAFALMKPSLVLVVLSPLILAGLHFFTRLSAWSVVKGCLAAIAILLFNYMGAVVATAAPIKVAMFTTGLLALVGLLALIKLDWIRRFVQGSAVRLAVVVLTTLALVGNVGFWMTFADVRLWKAPVVDSEELRLVGPFVHPYDVKIINPGLIAVFSGHDNAIHLVAPSSRKILKTAAFPEGVRPQRGAVDVERGRLFGIGYDPGRRREGTVGVAVVDLTSFSVEQWLPMPGCENAINIDIRPDRKFLVAMCEPQPKVYFYDLASLELERVETIPEEWFFMGYDLEFFRENLIVSSSLWPHVFQGTPSPDGSLLWTTHRTSSFVLPMQADHAAGRLYAALPLERRIAVLAPESLDSIADFRTAGLVRDSDIDVKAGWLFTASYFKGIAEQFDLHSGERLNSWKVGPLLRGVEWDPVGMQLYLSSADGVHRVDLRHMQPSIRTPSS